MRVCDTAFGFGAAQEDRRLPEAERVFRRCSGLRWLAACAKARKALGCKGFVAIKKGSALYNKAKGFYGKGSPKK